MHALIIRHHPKMIRHWAKNYVDWCLDPKIGDRGARNRMAFMFSAETISKLHEPIKEELKRRGHNAE